MRKTVLRCAVLAAAILAAAGIYWRSDWAPRGQADISSHPPMPAPIPDVERVFDPDFRPRVLSGADPPFTDFAPIAVTDADRLLKADELVVAVTIAGQSRAYPISVLNNETRRKALNDTLGGMPVVVTWCDLCHSAIAYSRQVDDQLLSFRVIGLWHNTMVMEDMETRSLWSFLLGEAKHGALKGKRLRQLHAVLTDWQTWRRQQPDGTVAWLDPSPLVDRGVYVKEQIADQLGRFVLVARNGAESKTWALDALSRTPLLNEEWAGDPVLIVFERPTLTGLVYRRKVEGRVLTFERTGQQLVDKETGSTWEPSTGRAVAGPLAGKELTAAPAMLVQRSTWEQLRSLRRRQ
jgi:hypothetical protein